MNPSEDIVVYVQPGSRLEEIFSQHPKVRVEPTSDEEIKFSVGSWNREIVTDQPGLEVAGLTELMDNNPMVCADVISVPSPLATLVLIALGPLAKAGLILESPVVICNAPGSLENAETFLAREGWVEGLTYSHEALEIGSVYALTAFAKVTTPEDTRIFKELYDECFGRSFFVRRDDASIWDKGLVEGEPFALYRLSLMHDQPESLLKIQVIADQDGKCGAAQIVHALNVMCGFEESVPY
jgi:hypothetical protein